MKLRINRNIKLKQKYFGKYLFSDLTINSSLNIFQAFALLPYYLDKYYHRIHMLLTVEILVSNRFYTSL